MTNLLAVCVRVANNESIVCIFFIAVVGVLGAASTLTICLCLVKYLIHCREVLARHGFHSTDYGETWVSYYQLSINPTKI